LLDLKRRGKSKAGRANERGMGGRGLENGTLADTACNQGEREKRNRGRKDK